MMSTIIPIARKLRRNQTEAEKLIWSKLRNNQMGCKFRRQHPVGSYITDFACIEKMLVIELDGGQHNDQVDQTKNDFIKSQGFNILRFWNNDVMENLEGVYQIILEKLYGPSP